MQHKVTHRAVPSDYGQIAPISKEPRVDHTPSSVLLSRNYAEQRLYPAGLTGQDIDFVCPADMDEDGEFPYQTPALYKPRLWQRTHGGKSIGEVSMNGRCETPKDGPRQRMMAHDGPIGRTSEPFRRAQEKHAWVTNEYPNVWRNVEQWDNRKSAPKKERKPRKPAERKPKTPDNVKVLASAVKAEIALRKECAALMAKLNKLSCELDSKQYAAQAAPIKAKLDVVRGEHYAAEKLVASLR